MMIHINFFLTHFAAGVTLITGFLIDFFETKNQVENGDGRLGWAYVGTFLFAFGVALLTI